MQFEFTDQVGEGAATPSTQVPPTPVSGLSLGDQGEVIASGAADTPTVAEVPAPSLNLAEAASPAPAARTLAAEVGGAQVQEPGTPGNGSEEAASAAPAESEKPSGVRSLMRSGKASAPGAAPAKTKEGAPAKAASATGRPAIFAAAGTPETAKVPESESAKAEGQTAPQRADATTPPAAPAGGGGAPPSGGQGGGQGGGGGGSPPPAGGAGGGGSGGGSGGASPPPGGARIGDKLVDLGLISSDQLQVALYERKRTNKLIGTLLVELGFISESALSSVLASASGFEKFDMAATVVEPELLKRFPKEVAQRYRVFPVSMEGATLRLAMADIYDVLALDQAHRFVPPGAEIIPLVSSEAEVLAAIDQFYGYEFSIDGILRELETGKHDTSTQALSGDGYLHPLVRLVNAILLDAVRNVASDIHFEPEGTFLRLRYRIDGVMQQIRTLQKDLWPAISHRLKIVSGMNIADKLNPQDGRFGFTYGSHRIDFRVAALPTVNGENIVIRILDKSRSLMTLETLGFSQHNLKLLDRLLLRPEGIIIVTGPTGSGKTTTLYAVLNKISTLERNIMTLEDPVEYELPLIRQSQVREGTGMNFSDGVRAMLRQDPDIIFIGEVRDTATAQMALRAAMTGHQVYSTLHTNDAASAIPRLHDLGLDHGLLAGNIIGILAQRLVRKICKTCSKMRPATAEECRIFGVEPTNPPMVAQPVGCDSCRQTGYKGRVAVHELLPFNGEIDEMIINGSSLAQVRTEARKYGYISLAEDGIAKVLDGQVTLESLMRTVDVTSRM